MTCVADFVHFLQQHPEFQVELTHDATTEFVRFKTTDGQDMLRFKAGVLPLLPSAADPWVKVGYHLEHSPGCTCLHLIYQPLSLPVVE